MPIRRFAPLLILLLAGCEGSLPCVQPALGSSNREISPGAAIATMAVGGALMATGNTCN